ncbi:MAG: ABC transporter permease [Dehalococcoidia bacterium]|nr:ABC transporter permease [Dehalococcoidia bacterium]MDW8120347.1 ABC transporter permease [Chloroflexota bacterium]
MLWPLVVANLKMLLRDRVALFWALLFPVVFVVGFGFFRFGEPPTSTVAVVDHAQNGASQGFLAALGANPVLKLEPYPDEERARTALTQGDVRYALILPPEFGRGGEASTVTMLYDRAQVTAPLVVGVVQRYVDEMNLHLIGAQRVLSLQAEPVQSRRLRYFDFVLPGLVGMAVMQFSIIGMAVGLAEARELKLLKRLQTTPLSVGTFFLARVLANMVLAGVQAGLLLAVGVLAFDAYIVPRGLVWGIPLIMVSNMIFLNLGFVAGAVSKTVNAASGLGNAIAMPMMIFSGVFFDTAGLPRVLAVMAQYLPLTPLIDSLRGMLLEAKPLWAYPVDLAILGGWMVVSAVLAVRLFRFT